VASTIIAVLVVILILVMDGTVVHVLIWIILFHRNGFQKKLWLFVDVAQSRSKVSSTLFCMAVYDYLLGWGWEILRRLKHKWNYAVAKEGIFLNDFSRYNGSNFPPLRKGERVNKSNFRRELSLFSLSFVLALYLLFLQEVIMENFLWYRYLDVWIKKCCFYTKL